MRIRLLRSPPDVPRCVCVVAGGLVLGALSVILGGPHLATPAYGIDRRFNPRLEKRAHVHKGRERSYYLRLPTDFKTDEVLPLVFVLHGGGRADGAGIARHIDLGELADRERFILVYPNGVDSQWNDGRGVSFRKDNSNEDVDDVGFLSQLIDHHIKLLHADARRVYVTGGSNGGMMAHRLGCEITSKLAAIAPIISNLPEKVAETAKPRGPLPVLLINGTADPLVPFKGGHVTVLGKKFGRVLSTDETVRFWSKNNRLSDKTSIEKLPDRDPDDDSTVTLIRHGDPKSPAPVVVYEIRGGGHTIPGSPQPPRGRRLVGPTNHDIASAEVIWTFFSQFPRD